MNLFHLKHNRLQAIIHIRFNLPLKCPYEICQSSDDFMKKTHWTWLFTTTIFHWRVCLGWGEGGITNSLLRFIFIEIWKPCVPVGYYIHIWQDSPHLRHRIYSEFNDLNDTCKSRNITDGKKLMNIVLVNPIRRHQHVKLSFTGARTPIGHQTFGIHHYVSTVISVSYE